MAISRLPAHLIRLPYVLARKTGWIDLAPVRRAFVRSYHLYKRMLEDPFYRLGLRHPGVFRGGNVIDAGANIGYTASVFHRFSDPASTVYAFEPDDWNYALLCESVRSLESPRRVKPVRAALGDHDGQAELWLNPRHHGDHRVVTEKLRRSVPSGSEFTWTPIYRIDSLVAQEEILLPVRFVKIDVQGFELPVLRGMAGLLERTAEIVIAVECDPGPDRESKTEARRVIEFLRGRSFRPWLLDRRGDLRELDSLALTAMLDKDAYFDVVWSREKLR
jgi:FkbM family methyltransferase